MLHDAFPGPGCRSHRPGRHERGQPGDRPRVLFLDGRDRRRPRTWTSGTSSPPRAEDATAIAVLDDPRRYSDLQCFLDDFYAFDGDPALEALSERVEILVFRARVLATKHRHERKKSKRPVRTGPVHFAHERSHRVRAGRRGLLGAPHPACSCTRTATRARALRSAPPLYVDGDYLLGPEAGHLNITGMSGLSTKTSHALFTIASTFQTVKDIKVAALMFNVKGADLLYLDKPVEVDPAEDPELAGRYEKAGQRGLPPDDREMYEALGLEIQPFQNLKVFAPLAFGRDGGESIVHAPDLQNEGPEHAAQRPRRGRLRLPHRVGPRGRAAARRAHLRPDGLRRQVQGLRRVPAGGAGADHARASTPSSTRRSSTSRRARAPTGTATTRRRSPRSATASAYCRASAPGSWCTAGSITVTRRRSTARSATARCASWTSRTSPACRRTSSSPRS